MVEPVWPGCVGVNNEFLDYHKSNEIKLFPWSSTARGFFIRKKKSTTKEHFSNPSLEEEKEFGIVKRILKEEKFVLKSQKKKCRAY